MFKITDGVPTPITDKEFRAEIAPAVPPRGYQKDTAFLSQFDVVNPSRAPKPTFDEATQTATPNTLPTLVEGVWTLEWAVVNRTVLAEEVKRERDRRLQLDFEFPPNSGKMFQRDARSIARISGAGTLALGAIMGGSQPGDYRWNGEAVDFAWIASDDSTMKMDAQTCFAFGTTAAKVESYLIHKAKALREMDPIPSDYTDDKYW